MSRLAELLDGVLTVDPAAPAIEFRRGWTSWGELGQLMAEISHHLDEHGFGADARIGLVLRNRPELMAAIAELLRSARCMVSLNASYPEERLAADVVETAVPALILVPEDWRKVGLQRAADAIDALVIAIDGGRADVVRRPQAKGANDRPSALAVGTALEMLTSGTTGKPKRIPIARAGFEKSLLDAILYESGRGLDDSAKLRSGVQILTAPFAHIAGVQAVMNVLLSGRKSALLEKFTVEAFRDAIVRHRPKVVAATPAGVRMLIDANVPREDLASLIAFRTGAAALDPDLADLFYERYGVPILQNYGATEFGAVAGWTPDDFRRVFHEKRGSVGRINPGVSARVVSPQDFQPLPVGETGLLELRAQHIGDGRSWLRTSDLAMLDDDMFLWIKGRADGAIIRGGFKVQPEDVANALQAHAALSEVAVIGLPDARLGAVPAAAFTVRDGAAAPTDEALAAFLRDKLLPYQIPARFLRVDDMPRTESMKVSLVGVKALFDG